MSRTSAILLVIAVSLTTPALMSFWPGWAQSHAQTLTFAWAVAGLVALAAVSDGRMTPWFARLGGRLFFGRGRGFWISLLFTLLLIGASAFWAQRLIDGKLITAAAFYAMLLLFIVVLAPWEELWWRGVWFAAASKNYWAQVLLGSMLFALGHAHRLFENFAGWEQLLFENSEGWKQLAVLLLSGIAFASLRRAGAPLVMLILLHGFANVSVRLTSLAPDSDVLLINATTIAMGVMAMVAIAAGFGKSRYDPAPD
jgi:hypothetical protein